MSDEKTQYLYVLFAMAVSVALIALAVEAASLIPFPQPFHLDGRS